MLLTTWIISFNITVTSGVTACEYYAKTSNFSRTHGNFFFNALLFSLVKFKCKQLAQGRQPVSDGLKILPHFLFHFK